MIFPVGDDNIEKGHKPFFSYIFLAINCVVFLYQAFLMMQGNDSFRSFIMTFGAIPAEILRGADMRTLLTSIFVHGGWMHLVGNMMFLRVFADNIEASIGNKKFVLFYIAGGVIASLAHILFNIGSSIPGVGASGSIAAVLGAYLCMFPQSRIKVFIIYNMKTFLVPAYMFLGFWFFQQFFGLFGSAEGGVARRAHIGGFVFGYIMGQKRKSSVHLMRP